MNDESIILVVEDNEDDAILLRKALRSAQLNNPLKIVRDGEEALAYLSGSGPYRNTAENPLPDLIILDLKMPGTDGFDVLEWRQQHRGIRRIPVLILTSSDDSEDVHQAYYLGANSFFTKPSAPSDLFQLARSIRTYWTTLTKTGTTFRPHNGAAA